MNKKVIGFSLGLSMVFISVSIALAQSTTDVQVAVPTLYSVEPVTATVGDVDTTQTSTCIDLTSEAIRYRSSDKTTNGEVTELQDFLVATSLLKTQVTGYFGLATFTAVKQFQKRVGLNPTGYVGQLTKAKIKEISCNGGQLPTTQEVGNRPIQGVKNDMMPRPMPFDTASGTREMSRPPFNGSSSPFPPMMRGSTSPEVPSVPRGEMGTGTIKVPPVVACTMEARLCSNGQMMARNLATCEWITSSCDTTKTVPSDVKPAPQPLQIPPTSSLVCPAIAKLCSNGKPMPFKPGTCDFDSSVCGTSSGGSSNSGSLAPVPPVPLPPVSGSSGGKMICTMEMRFCPNGTPVPRDSNCVWRTDKCPVTSSPSGSTGTSLPTAKGI